MRVEPKKLINWWTGRFSDEEAGEWTGLAPRAVGLVLALPKIRMLVHGGGRGSKLRRRVHPTARNALAVIQAASEAGLSLELASNILNSAPVLACEPTRIVDYQALVGGIVMLDHENPRGGWFPGESIPRDVFNGDELDPMGWFSSDTEPADERVDSHVIIVDGRFVFESSVGNSLSAFEAIATGSTLRDDWIKRDTRLVGEILPDKKSVKTRWDRDFGDIDVATRFSLKNFKSRIDINVTLAVRKMKRKAIGLPVETTETPVPWSERPGLAARVDEVLRESAEQKFDNPYSPEVNFFRAWTKDADGNNIRVGLTKLETDEFEAYIAKEIEEQEHFNDPDYKWPSAEESARARDRHIELHEKHELARLARLGAERESDTS
jgi:hypothetical protein